ncbi:facilitated trehalose transporter Tret1-like [Ostrinia nubilalis]|uniref:facilitated trehalose transporter Tret1-like n=1 Tax=Ostrinia nubilalis TaxID=29057 RepID=UPI0030825206
MEHRSRIVQYLVAASVSLASLTLGVSSAWPTPVLPKFHANETGVEITDQGASWMLAMNSPGFIAGSFATRFISDKFGRKATILVSAYPMALGTIVLLFAKTAWLLYITRFLWGASTGMIGTVVSMYLAEIADKDLRGTLSVGTRFMFNLGTLLAISVGPFLSYQALNSSLIVLPVCYFVACWWIPESPYYYLKEGRVHDAGKTLTKLRSYKDKKEMEDELSALQSSVANEMRRDSSVKELFTGKQYRRAIIISTGLKLAQIMVGVVTVQHYLGRIMQDTKSDINLATIFIIFGAVRFVIGIMSSILADRVGRRPLLIYSFLGTAICHIIAGAYFFCQEVLQIDQASLTPYVIIPLIGIFGSSIVSTIGFGSIIFVIPAEIFPINIKAVALSALSIYGGVLGFIVAKFFQDLKDWTGLCGVFWIYSGVAIAGAVFSLLCVPETKGKSLEEIQILLQGDLYDGGDGRTSQVAKADEKDTELQELNKKDSTNL